MHVNNETVNLKYFDNFFCSVSDLQKNKETIKNGKINMPPMRQSNCHTLLINIDRLYGVTPFNKCVKDATRETWESPKTNSINAKEITNTDHRFVKGFSAFKELFFMI
jgi:hypothetical protein